MSADLLHLIGIGHRRFEAARPHLPEDPELAQIFRNVVEKARNRSGPVA
jgi:hypothetical protein